MIATLNNGYPYERSYTDRYILSRDGKVLLRGTEHECWVYLHRTCGYSVSHALLHEGFMMEAEGTTDDG